MAIFKRIMVITMGKMLILILIIYSTPCLSGKWQCSFSPKYVWPASEKELDNWKLDKEFDNVKLIHDKESLFDVLLVNHSTKDFKKTLYYDVYDAEMLVNNTNYQGFYDSHRRMYFFTSNFNFSTKVLIAKSGEAVLSESFGVWEGKCKEY